MFELLKSYVDKGSFRFKPNESLKLQCNAPLNKAGVYLVYDCSNGKELIYVGSSGHITNDGKKHVRTSGGGGLNARLVNGKQFNKEKRRICWPKQMITDDILELEVVWYVTEVNDVFHSPCYVEHCVLHEFYILNRMLPRWNKKF